MQQENKQMEWQPIETYVPDDKAVIVWARHKNFGVFLEHQAFLAKKWRNGRWMIVAHPSTGCRCYDITHWMPLPKPPTKTGE
jgi:hypothetical protein